MRHSATWPLAACLVIGAGSSTGEQDAVAARLRILRPATVVMDPAAPIAVAEWASLYPAVLVGKVRRGAPGGAAGRRG